MTFGEMKREEAMVDVMEVLRMGRIRLAPT
jgi:hypothetical protein